MLKPIGLLFIYAFCASAMAASFDVILRNAEIYDGSGSAPMRSSLAISGDKIVRVAEVMEGQAKLDLDLQGLALAPGFINMLSWANESLIHDGRAQSVVRQGVTLEVLGEGESMGPLNRAMKRDMRKSQGDIKYKVEWSTLGEYLDHLVERGVSVNVASFVGATTLRIHEIGYADRPPTSAVLTRMCRLAAQAMEQGALGVSSSLIYAPAFYAKTDELIALAKVAARYKGMYISHIRSEGNQLLEAADELIQIAREASVPAQFYHLKAAGQQNWGKLPALIEKIEKARTDGLKITADMYLYTAGATGLDAAMPPWVQEGGYAAWKERLTKPEIRKRVAAEMRTPTNSWENLYLAAGSAEKVILIAFKSPALKPLTGKTLAEVAAMRSKSPEETAMDLVIEDGSRVGAVYFLMSEENVRKQVQLPWVSFDSDEAALAPEGIFLKTNPHPRAYGNFARLLGKYVRDEKLISLQEAIRRLTAFPAETLKLKNRGKIQAGYFADIVVFDPKTIQDHATYARPHQYSTGVKHVFVNGKAVLLHGEHTGAKPGRVIHGPGYTGKTSR